MKRTIVLGILACCVASAADPVGLSLNFRNGQMAPIPLLGNAPRYLQEVDIVVTTAPSATDQGVQPLIANGELSSLNWSGVQMVEEDWRPNLAGPGLVRQRFYRGATWMNRAGFFLAQPLNGSGVPTGLPLLASTGLDSNRTALDDGFIRRFVARQIATGCPAVNNCTGATFVAEGLVQWRGALHPTTRSATISPSTTQIKLIWSEDLLATRSVAVSFPPSGTFSWGYGFAPQLAAVNAPANGQYYQPGEQVTLRITFRDGAGNRLHPPGSLPTMSDVFFGVDTSGIKYINLGTNPTLYYALKHREANTIVQLSGPTNHLKVPVNVTTLLSFFAPQVTTATTAADGWTGLAITVPPAPVIFSGPPAWGTPVSDSVTFTLPADALPGTYTATIKARREFGGEALNRSTTIDLQVGTTAPTTFVAKTGPCTTCHTQQSQLGLLLHGNSDRRTCFTCHSTLDFEPDNYLDFRVHAVHDRSKRFDSNIQNCAQCHLTPPAGPARGLLNP